MIATKMEFRYLAFSMCYPAGYGVKLSLLEEILIFSESRLILTLMKFR